MQQFWRNSTAGAVGKKPARLPLLQLISLKECGKVKIEGNKQAAVLV
jgi:hypothetical protein